MGRDLTAGLVVFLVAVPLCLGVAESAGAPSYAGLIAGLVGGIVVGYLSRSQTSVSGPALGMTSVVVAQFVVLGSWPAFAFAVVIAGAIQIVVGLFRGGVLVAFIPASVTKAFLAAIGIILVLKHLPHLVGHDANPEGNLEFLQLDQQNTFSELAATLGDLHLGAAVIGMASVALLLAWNHITLLKRLPLPASLAVIILGTLLSLLFRSLGGDWLVTSKHLVQIPRSDTPFAWWSPPDFTQWRNPSVYLAAVVLAAAASLETLLNLRVVDKIDPQQRRSPPNRELWAQGVGNVLCGLAGGLPITSVIVQSSVNIEAGAKTRRAAIFHGILLATSMLFLVETVNLVPLASVAAILLVAGIHLATPNLFRQMWRGGKYVFVPFILTIAAIVFSDPLTGVLIGLAVSLSFILWSNVRRPVRKIIERHLQEDVVHIELASQVSFLNRASLDRAFDEIPAGGHVLLDARDTDYIDPDILGLIRDFTEIIAPARQIEVSLIGFRSEYRLEDQIQFIDYSTRDLQTAATPAQVLEILIAGHERFRTGRRLTRNLSRQVMATADAQHPLAVVLSCIDSRSPAELIFDLGVGDIFSVRVAGNVISPKVLGSIEYACAVAQAKLIVVMGHTRCGAVTAAVDLRCTQRDPVSATGCDHITEIISELQKSIAERDLKAFTASNTDERKAIVDQVARRNVTRVARSLVEESGTLTGLIMAGKIAIVGVMYDVKSGEIEILPEAAHNLCIPDAAASSS